MRYSDTLTSSEAVKIEPYIRNIRNRLRGCVRSMTAAARSAYASGVSVERQPSQHRNEGNLPVFSALYVRSSLDARITSTLGMGGWGLR